MPSLATNFGYIADRTVAFTAALEYVRRSSNLGSLGRAELTPARLELAYEIAFLRIFAEWETLLEEVTVRHMCGYTSSMYAPTFPPGIAVATTINAARITLLGGNRFVLWHDTGRNLRRVGRLLVGCPVETVTLSARTWLDDISAIRHRVAHRSDDARINFDSATLHLAAQRFRGSSAGNFLRSQDPSTGDRRIAVVVTRFKRLAAQLAP
jgi:hypothetical protein